MTVTLNFIAKLVETLAWPATVLIIFFCCRKSLLTALPLLNRLKYGELEAEFHKMEEYFIDKRIKDKKIIIPQDFKAVLMTGSEGKYRKWSPQLMKELIDE